MDGNATAIIAFTGLALSIGTTVLTAINHRRIRSTCCRKELEVSLDIEQTTPPSSSKPSALPSHSSGMSST